MWLPSNSTVTQQATHIDDTDITTWLQLSRVAQLQGNLLIARMALEKVNYRKCCFNSGIFILS